MVTEKDALRHHSRMAHSDHRIIDSWTRHAQEKRLLDVLDPNLKCLSVSTVDHDRLTGHPTPAFSLIVSAFSLLKHEQDKAKRDEVAEFLGTTLFPMARIPVHEATMIGSATTGYYKSGACFRAERHFVRSAHQSVSGEYSDQPGLRTYHDSDGRAVVFGKEWAIRTAVLLCPVMLESEEVTLPAGTIVNIDDENLTQTSEQPHGRWTGRTYQVGPGFSVQVDRLSAWANEAELDRSLYGVTASGSCYIDSIGDLVTANTLATFQEAATVMLSNA